MHSKLAVAIGIVAIGVFGAVLPGWAHHAHGHYATELTDFEGVVTEVHVLNPHSWVYVSRKNAAGDDQVVAIEAAGAAFLRKLEAQGQLLKVGDKVKVRCHALIDKSPGCLVGYIKHPDGRVFNYAAMNESDSLIVTLPGF